MSKIKAKAIIWKPNRTNQVVILKKKQLEGKTFRVGDCQYFVDPDRFMLTEGWRFGKKRNYTTFYYREGVSSPVPVPNLEGWEEPIRDEKGNVRFGTDGKPVMTKVFPKVINQGVSAEELAAIFNPWFYRIIANPASQIRQDIQFWLVIGIAFGVGYLVWQMQDLPNQIAQLIPPPAPNSPPPGTLNG